MGGNPDQNESAVSILLNNVGTKIFFRTTDEGTMRRIRPLCPSQPGWPAAVDVRPPSTLAPGQCYAALPDGRFERRQLAPCFPGGSDREPGTEPDKSQESSTGTAPRRSATVLPLFEPRGEG